MKEPVNQAEFDQIVRDTHTYVRAFIAGMGVSRSDVDDLAQDVYIELYKNFDRVPADATPLAWLKGIARNLCLSHFRKNSRRARLHREALADLLARTETPLETSLVECDVREALTRCYEKLPDKSQKLLVMCYQEKMTSAAMAEALASTAEAIRIALFRIRGSLKECITRSLAAE